MGNLLEGASVHPLSVVHQTAVLGLSCRVWAWTQLRENVTVGDGTSFGQGCYVGPGVTIGNQCRIQNGALIYEPSVLGDSVFVGPGTVFTNDRFPRAVNIDGSPKKDGDWSPDGVQVERGASIGARAVLIGPVKVGQWAMVGAGSVVTADVKPYALVLGIPAVQVGWVGKSGRKLIKAGEVWQCPETHTHYVEREGELTFLDESRAV